MPFLPQSPSIVFDLPFVPASADLSTIAMRRMRGAAIIVAAMAIGRPFIARVGLTFVGTKLVPGFCFAGTSVMPAFHAFHLELNWQTSSAEE